MWFIGCSCIVHKLDLDLAVHLQAMKAQPTEFEPVPMDSEDDLFIAYTSGTTNNPRRIVHSQAGYLLYTAFTHKVLL